MLHLALGGGLGRSLSGARYRVEEGLLGALVAEQEADVGLVAGDRGHAGVHIHIIVDGDVVVAVGGLGHVSLAEDGVQKAVLIQAVVIVLLHDEVGGVDPVHPVGHVLVIGALAGDGVHQNRALDVGAAEQADGLDHPAAHPVGGALVVDFKHRLGKHHGGELEPQMAVEVAAEVLGGGVLHALVQAHHLRLLGHHVDDEVSGQALGAVGEPLDDVAVGKAGHPHRAALVVDLGVGGQNLKLAHHVRQLAQLAAAQPLGAVGVQHGDLVVADLVHLAGEIAGLHRQKLCVAAGADDLPGEQRAHQNRHRQAHHHKEGQGALLFHKGEIPLHVAAFKPRGEDGAGAVDRAEQEDKDVELLGLEVQRRKLQIEIDQAEDQGHQQVHQHPCHRAFDHKAPGLAGRTVGLAAGVAGAAHAAHRKAKHAAEGVVGIELKRRSQMIPAFPL